MLDLSCYLIALFSQTSSREPLVEAPRTCFSAIAAVVSVSKIIAQAIDTDIVKVIAHSVQVGCRDHARVTSINLVAADIILKQVACSILVVIDIAREDFIANTLNVKATRIEVADTTASTEAVAVHKSKF